MAGELTDRQVSEVVYSLKELRELSDMRREASDIASAIKYHTRMQEEQLNSIRCWLAGVVLLMLMGIGGLIVLLCMAI